MLHAHGRVVKVAAYPIGIHPDAIAQAAVDNAGRKPVKALREAMRGRKLVMSVDRLDYSKGLVERFQAFERMLANAPGWQGRVSLVQIAPPTRSDVQSYQGIRQTLEGEAGAHQRPFGEPTGRRFITQPSYSTTQLPRLFRCRRSARDAVA